MKYSVHAVYAPTVAGWEEADEHYLVLVRNRAGREWVNKHASADAGTVSENAMVVSELVNGGGKLDPELWDEVPEVVHDPMDDVNYVGHPCHY